MKTPDHYNILNDPNFITLAALLRQFVIEYQMSKEKAEKDIKETFKLTDIELKKVIFLSKINERNR